MGWKAGVTAKSLEWMPAWMRWCCLVDADLAQMHVQRRKQLFQKADDEYQCVLSWRKDRHSEHDMAIPYRISVRGESAEACMEWLLDLLCTEHKDLISPESIWGLPVPETSHHEVVEAKVMETVVRIQAQSDARLDHNQPVDQDRPTSTAQQIEKQAAKSKAGLTATTVQLLQTVNANAIQKWQGLHWQYQNCMNDNLGQPLPQWLHHQVHPADLELSTVHELLSEPHVLLCTSTFKRDWQCKESLSLNLPQTLPWTRRVTWCVFDANPDEHFWLCASQ